MSTLAIPDPRKQPVPVGWFQDTAAPTLAEIEAWDDLDEIESRLRAITSYIDSFDGDATEFEKALRMVEKRRADLLGPAQLGGDRKSDQFSRAETDFDVSPATAFRWRKIQKHWDKVIWPHIIVARNRNQVTQSRCLKIIDEWTPAAPQAVKDVEESPEFDTSHDIEFGEQGALLFGEFQRRLESLPDGSIDLILTDPPYPNELEHLWSELAKLAVTKLSPRGYLMAMSGKIHLDRVMNRLGEHLNYGWMFNWPLEGAASRILGRNIRQTWKPILAYTVDTWPRREPVQDTVPTGLAEKDLDGWQQQVPPARWIIDAFSPPDGLVVDPFLGTGSFVVAAKEAGRRFIGVELRQDRLAQAAERLRV